jgi:hypothetical protein
MADRYDVLTGSKYTNRDGEEKTFFTKIGTMFRNKTGESFSLELIALPLPDKEGRVRLLVKEPQPRDGSQQVRRSEPSVAPRSMSKPGDIDDDIPFD